MGEKRITISPRVSRRTYFEFRDLCHSHRISVESGIDRVLRKTLEQAGVLVSEDEQTDDLDANNAGTVEGATTDN